MPDPTTVEFRAALRRSLEGADRLLAESLEPLARTVPSFSEPGRFLAGLEAAVRDFSSYSRGRDAHHDVPEGGVEYAAYYQLRRVHHLVRALQHAVLTAEGAIGLADLGCGVGACAWAVALLERARLEAGLGGPRRIHVAGTDTSPIMIDAGEWLWARVGPELLGPAANQVTASFAFASWQDLLDESSVGGSAGWLGPIRDSGDLSSVTLVGSYVFDHSDRDTARTRALGNDLARVADRAEADRIILVGPSNKVGILEDVTARLRTTGRNGRRAKNAWATGKGLAPPLMRPEHPTATHRARTSLYRDAGGSARFQVTWYHESEQGLIALERPQRRLEGLPRPSLELDDEQRVAASGRRSPTWVSGVAGSGKTEVLIRRVVEAIREPYLLTPSVEAQRRLRVLVTAHHKYLVEHIRDRVLDELADLRGPRVTPSITRCAHRGKPRRGAFDCTARLVLTEEGAVRSMTVCGTEPAHSPTDRTASIRFINWDGAVVRILGWKFKTRDDGEEREALLDRLDRSRRAVPHSAESSPSFDPFDVIVVDEGQDLDAISFRLLEHLLSSGAEHAPALVAADPAQAFIIGQQFARPDGLAGLPWDTHALGRSHRLSMATARAVAPVASLVLPTHDSLSADPLRATKTAIPGVRPILLSNERATEGLREILQVHRRFFETRGGRLAPTTPPLLVPGDCAVAALVADLLAEQSLPSAAPNGPHEEYRLGEWKGLDFNAVIWSTDAGALHPFTDHSVEPLAEAVLTVLTRARGLLVLVLAEGTSTPVRRVVASIDPDTVRYWDELARDRHDRWREEIGATSNGH